jgi:hypothetical protein
MKARSIFLLCFFIQLISVAQNNKPRHDTIFVSSNHLTTILFSEPVTYLALGSEDFVGTAEGKTVILKAGISNPPPPSTTILIKYGADERIYHGAISFAPIPPISFIDFSEKKPTKELNPSLSVAYDSATIEAKMINRRIGIMEGITKDRIKEIAIKTDGIILSVSDLIKDEDYLFVKILFLNKSKTDYAIDFVDFAYHTPREDRSYQGREEIKPVPVRGSNEVKLIPVKSEKYLVYAVPRFIMTSKGFMKLTVREKKGARILSLDVPYKLIESTKNF